ncbi:MAG: hypothetical protein V4757_04525 [Pseudomonadota bacterium]
MTKPYSVALLDAAALPFAARVKAEGRYAAVLEMKLGGADEVAAVYRAWSDATESDPTMLDAHTAELAIRWPAAAKAADDAATRDLGHFEGIPHFQVRLERRSEAAA